MNHHSFLQVNSPEKANEFVTLYDQAIASPSGARRVHRVSHYLARDQPGSLGRDLRRFAAGKKMSRALQLEILAYQLVVLDDGVQESPHALVSKLASSARSSRPAWWSSSIRFEQNCKSKQALDAIETGRFAKFFDKWKVMGQCKWHEYAKLKNQRVKTKPFLHMIYRTGSHNRKEWSFLALIDKSTDIPKDIEDIGTSDVQDVRIDFLKRAFPTGRIVTWPVSSSIGAVEDMGTGGHEHRTEQYPLCYQVISADVANKKYVDTDSVARMRKMRLPLVVQKYGHWCTTQYPCEALDVYADGLPLLIDMYSEIDFDVYGQLCHWDLAGPSDAHGCWSLKNPQIYSSKQWRNINIYHESSNVHLRSHCLSELACARHCINGCGCPIVIHVFSVLVQGHVGR